MFSTVLIANRGEIALRIARTCRELGIRTVIVHSTADRDSAAVRYADEAVQIGPAPSRRSYLNAAAIVTAALQTGAEAIHPGYGFLSENPDFAEICEANGLTFIGPPAEVMARLGDKALARGFAVAAGLPVLPGSTQTIDTGAEAKELADSIGYPVIIKAAAGGGGRGVAVVHDPGDFLRAYAETSSSAHALFGDGRVYVEKYLTAARHVEVQVLADKYGNVIHVGARDCSVQRRRQKLVEESPPPGLPPPVVDQMCEAAAAATAFAGYVGAGTFEFVVDDEDNYYFMEVNCRIQVEHPVSEMISGLDLIRHQLLVASGCRMSLDQSNVELRGAAIEVRVNAEDPARGFLPTPGTLDRFAPPAGAFTRVDSHGYPGMRVTADYDPLLAKVIVWAPDRDQAIARLDRALGEFEVTGRGVHTTIDFLREVLAYPAFVQGRHTTSVVDQMFSEREAGQGRQRPDRKAG